ncbi:hypothetical protein RJ639_018360 [Escallonia herrerae]|uniref:Growth-regulating factor n=1 Tax=Escallonia herrerae TaxID=1293975 RepID=A0AA89AJ18_9ASTE|nr:hypothetical protein RJ639_018360 [Escallonia herrerae]
MDFGVVGFEDTSNSGFAAASSLAAASDAETKQKWYGSVRCSEDDWRDLKVAKTDDFSASKAMLQMKASLLNRSNTSTTNTSLQLSDGGSQQMLCFSSPNSQTLQSLPYYHPTLSAYVKNTGMFQPCVSCHIPFYTRTEISASHILTQMFDLSVSGYVSGGLNAASMHGVLAGVKGPFTPSQWMELEHQALIYKYITANAPIPSNLLIPIRKALESAGFSSFPGNHLRPSTLGWGAFHLGFANNTDPEPGRCRRTDGKKWRCSRDAVADGKYCERHMNRGRHRSRKPVEGQTGHSVSGTTNTTTKSLPLSSTSASVVHGGGASSGLGLSHHHQLNNLQPGASNPSGFPHINRSFVNKANVGEKVQDTTGLSMLSPAVGHKENQFSIQKQQNAYEDPSRMEFGLVCSDSLLNPLHKNPSMVNCRNYRSEELNERETKSPQSLRQFMDEWPKNQSDRLALSWPETGMQSDRTQLSISIPMAASDFMSSTSSPTNIKLALSPLRLSRELESTQMGLGVGAVLNEPNQKQANWIPISWENSMGGPLGEVLHSTNNSASDCRNVSPLNLMTEGWDNSPRLASSPTGVLQKTTFRSLSNSSAGSSPRTENNLLGSTHTNSSLPAL